MCVGVKGTLSHAGPNREWLLSTQPSLIMRDNGLNVSISFKGLLLPNTSIQVLVEGQMENQISKIQRNLLRKGRG